MTHWLAMMAVASLGSGGWARHRVEAESPSGRRFPCTEAVPQVSDKLGGGKGRTSGLDCLLQETVSCAFFGIEQNRRSTIEKGRQSRRLLQWGTRHSVLRKEMGFTHLVNKKLVAVAAAVACRTGNFGWRNWARRYSQGHRPCCRWRRK